MFFSYLGRTQEKRFFFKEVSGSTSSKNDTMTESVTQGSVDAHEAGDIVGPGPRAVHYGRGLDCAKVRHHPLNLG